MVTDCVIGHLSMMSLAFKTQNLADDLLQKVFNVTFLITYAVCQTFQATACRINARMFCMVSFQCII